MHRHEIPEDVIQPKIDVAKGFLKNLSTSPRRTLAITSFSAKKDNRNMWENYAGNYSGFCVEYDFSKAPSEGYIKYTWDVLHLLPITYFGKRPVFDPTALLREMVQAELKQSDISFGDDFLEQYFRAITAKGYDYRAENEWRMIVSDSYAGEYSFPYISKIIVGKDMSKENELTMHEVATELSVPMLKQALSENENTYIYVPYRPGVWPDGLGFPLCVPGNFPHRLQCVLCFPYFYWQPGLSDTVMNPTSARVCRSGSPYRPHGALIPRSRLFY